MSEATITVEAAGHTVQIEGRTVEDGPGPFLTVIDPVPMEPANYDPAGFVIRGQKVVMVHTENVVAVEAPTGRLGRNLSGDVDA